MENKTLMKEAREALSGKWLLAVGVFFVYSLIVGGIQGVGNGLITEGVGSLLTFIIAPPFALGIIFFSLSIARGEEASFGQFFDGFSDYWRAFKTFFLVVIFTILWTLLLIIPGIIMSIAYAMTFYILADDKEIGAMDAIRKSKKMMYGYKWKYFRLQVRFFGLFLLCFIPFGIAVFLSAPNTTPLAYFGNFYSFIPLSLIFLTIVGFLLFLPYVYVTTAKFYDDVKGNFVEEED